MRRPARGARRGPRQPVAAIGQRQRTTQGHEQRTQPQQRDQRPDLRAQAPASGTQVIPQGDEQVRAVAVVDAGDLAGLLLHPEGRLSGYSVVIGCPSRLTITVARMAL